MMTPGELDEQIHWEAEQHIPVRHQAHVDRLRGPAPPARGRADGPVPRRRQEGRDQRLRRASSARPSFDRSSSTSTRSPSRTSSSTSTGLPGDAHDRPLERGRRGVVAQHRGQGRERVHPRDHQRGQRYHRGDSQSRSRARTSRPRPTSTAAATTQIVPQEVTQIINQACQALAGEIQRSLDFYLATSGEQEISRIYVSGGSAYLAPLVQAIERRARVPVQVFDPMVNLVGRRQGRQRAAAPRDGCAARRRARALASLRQGAPAMVRINLLPERRGQAGRRTSAVEPGQLWLVGVLGAAVATIVGLPLRPEDEGRASSRRSSRTTASPRVRSTPSSKQISDHPQITSAPQGAPRSRGRHPEAAVGAHRSHVGAARALAPADGRGAGADARIATSSSSSSATTRPRSTTRTGIRDASGSPRTRRPTAS